MSDTTRSDDRSPDQIRRDIQLKREEMNETVMEIEDRLSAGQILDEVWSRVKSGKGRGVGDMVRDHPVPLALMGLGLGWLAVEQSGGSRRDHRSHDDGPGPADPYGSADRSEGYVREQPLSTHAKEKLDDVKEGVSDAVAGAKESVSETFSDMKDALRPDADAGSDDGAAHRRASEFGAKARHGARQAERSFWGAVEDNPLAMGALAFGVGLASGVSVPTSKVEDRLMGRAADAVKDEARELADDATDSAKAVARDAAEAARAETVYQKDAHGGEGSLGGQTKEAVAAVAEAATNAARQRAEAEGLTGDGLKEKVATAGERARKRVSGDEPGS